MKFRFFQLVLVALLSLSFTGDESENTTVKCMIQMKNYTGEGAYVVISLMKSETVYEKTIYVHGKDPEWYSDIPSWWKFYGKYRPNIDAISGATISGGERSMSVLELPTNKINAGYKLRFETAVEDQEYYETDLEIDLVNDNLKSKLEGKGWIRYVRLMAQN